MQLVGGAGAESRVGRGENGLERADWEPVAGGRWGEGELWRSAGAGRALLGSVAADFRDMPAGGVMNWCCGGGGGVSANDRAEELRLKAFNRKKRQVEATGAGTLVTACANCRIVLEEGLEHNEMNVEVVGLTELIAEYLTDDEPAKATAGGEA